MSDSVSIYKLGIYGKAYDVPGTRRAYTYQHQPDNQGAWRIGEAMSIASKAGGGDYIDTGLGLLKQLELKGYGVYELEEAGAPEVQHEPVAVVKENPFCPEGKSDEISAYLPVGTRLYLQSQSSQVNGFPALDEHLRYILGRPNFWCYSLANALRAMGKEIARKAEEEQAAVIHWLLEAYFKHGPGWREAVEKILAAEREKELAKGGDK
ncbi:hypothetical protein VLF92_12885 [Pseudomonas chengduensis]